MQALLKVINSFIGMAGIAMILYALWMFRAWQRHTGPPLPDTPLPWFIYSFLCIGVVLCVITCSGHIAAETANGCCLCFYMLFVFVLLLIEAAVTVDIILNRNWEEDFPVDPTGNLDEFKDFVKENYDICKLIGLVVVAVQGTSILLAIILRALGPHPERYYDSDDDYSPDRVPLLRHYVPAPSYAVADPNHASKCDSWNIRINSKANR